MRLAAILGCLALLAGSVVTAMLVIPRSWRELDDAYVRMHLFRFHVYDPDFIASAVAFGTTIVAVAAMFAVSMWMFWLLRRHWDMTNGNDETQR